MIVRRRTHALEFIYQEWGRLQCDGELGLLCFDSWEHLCGVDGEFSRMGSLPLVVRNMYLLECALLEYPFIADVIFSSSKRGDDLARIRDVVANHFIHSGHGSFGINFYYQGKRVLSSLHPCGLYRCLDDIVFLSRIDSEGKQPHHSITTRQFISERVEGNEFASYDLSQWAITATFDLSSWMEELGLEKLQFIDRMMVDKYQLVIILGFEGVTVLTDPITILSGRFVEASKKAVRSKESPIHLASSIYPFVPNLYSRMFVGEVDEIELRISYGYLSSDKYCSVPKDSQLVFEVGGIPSGDALFCEYEKERFLNPTIEPLPEEDV